MPAYQLGVGAYNQQYCFAISATRCVKKVIKIIFQWEMAQ